MYCKKEYRPRRTVIWQCGAVFVAFVNILNGKFVLLCQKLNIFTKKI